MSGRPCVLNVEVLWKLSVRARFNARSVNKKEALLGLLLFLGVDDERHAYLELIALRHQGFMPKHATLCFDVQGLCEYLWQNVL